jgi:hypothetical protein
MQFVKDMGTESGFSKFNRLATQVAMRLHGTRYACHDNSDTAVWQLGDGMAIVDRYYRYPVVIVHDWFPQYERYLENARKVIFLGNFEHPSVKRSYTLEGYPYDPLPLLPFMGVEVLLYGVYDGSCHDMVIEQCRGKDVRFACFDNDDSECECKQAELFEELKTVAHGLDVSRKTSELMLETYARSSKLTLHCGSGTRGFLHGMAVAYGGKSQKCDDGYTVPAISAIVDLLR